MRFARPLEVVRRREEGRCDGLLEGEEKRDSLLALEWPVSRGTPNEHLSPAAGQLKLVAEVSSTTSTGAWSASSSRTEITWSLRSPSEIVSPGLHAETAVRRMGRSVPVDYRGREIQWRRGRRRAERRARPLRPADGAWFAFAVESRARAAEACLLRRDEPRHKDVLHPEHHRCEETRPAVRQNKRAVVAPVPGRRRPSLIVAEFELAAIGPLDRGR